MEKIIINGWDKTVYIKDCEKDPLKPEGVIKFDCQVRSASRSTYVISESDLFTIGIKFRSEKDTIGYWQYFPKECIPEIIKGLQELSQRWPMQIK